MRKIFLGLSIILVICLSSSVFAATCLQAKPCGFAKTGIVVGAMAGYGKLNTPERDIFTENTGSLPDFTFVQNHKIGYFTWGINLGYNYAITSKWQIGFLMNYKDLGRSRYYGTYTSIFNWTETGKVKIMQQTIDFLLNGQYFIYQGINIFAQAGGALLRTHRKNFHYDGNVTPSQTVDWNKTLYDIFPEIAFGIGYMINNFNLYVMYDHILHENGDTQLITSVTKDSGLKYNYGFDGIFAGFTYTIPKEYI